MDFYEVDVTSVGPDFKREFVPEVGSYPKFRFYKNGEQIEKVRYQQLWENQEPLVRSKLSYFNSNHTIELTAEPVHEILDIDEFQAQIFGQDGKVTAVLFHNGNFAP